MTEEIINALAKIRGLREHLGHFDIEEHLVAEAKYKAALHYIDIALQLDPFSHINYHLKGFIYYAQEKYSEALELFEKSMSLNPEAQVSVLYRGQTLLLQERSREGLAFFQGLPGKPGELTKLGGCTLAYAALGDMEAAQKGIAELESALQTDQMERAMNLLILCRTLTGEHEAAMDLIEQGIGYRLPMLVYLSIEPLLKPLFPSTRFQEQMQRVLGAKSNFEGQKSRYKQSLLDKELLEQYRDQLIRLMSTDHPYLDMNLTLRDLAALLGILPNQFSRVLNEGFDQDFAEFVNTYRLESFKAKVADPRQRHLTILGLA